VFIIGDKGKLVVECTVFTQLEKGFVVIVPSKASIFAGQKDGRISRKYGIAALCVKSFELFWDERNVEILT
jgi:hypothetical protein